MALDIGIRDNLSKARSVIFQGLPYSSLYRPVIEAISITPKVVVFLYGNPEVTKVFLQRYVDVIFNEENVHYHVGSIENISEKEVYNTKTNLIVLDEVFDDDAVAKRINEFRSKRRDDSRIMLVRPAGGSDIDKFSKVGCKTTLASDAFIPFPHRSSLQLTSQPKISRLISTDLILYLRLNVFPNRGLDERRVRSIAKLFDYLGRLKYLRYPPKMRIEAVRGVLKSYHRYRNKQEFTISDVSTILPLLIAPKLLVAPPLIRRRLEKARYYLKKYLGKEPEEIPDEELLKYTSIGPYVVFDVLRFAESIVRYILST